MEYRVGNIGLKSSTKFSTFKQKMIPLETRSVESSKFNTLKVVGQICCITISFVLITSCSSSQKKELGTFEDPEVALKETQKALNLLSENLNIGYQSVNSLNEYEITKNKIFNLK